MSDKATLLREQLMNQKMKVDFNAYDFTIKEIISMVQDRLINISPDYQRHFRWGKERQSQLIESFFLGIPVPNIFMATNADSTWELIDGVQRLSSIINFVGSPEEREFLDYSEENEGPLRLEGLSKLKDFNGMCFNELPVDIQTKLKLTTIKVTTLSDKSDKNVRFDLFERLNKGGVSLSDQEIRSCVYRGPFNDFIKELSDNSDFCEVVNISNTKEIDGTKEELILRFFAYIYDIDSFDHSVKDFLNDYMAKADKKFDYNANRALFCTVFKALNEALENGISRNGRKNTPLNLYEAVSVGAALAYMETGEIITDGINEWISDEELKKYTTGATNSKPRVIGRIQYCKERFEAK